uniref:WD40/YVTN/BNR-like repeat-containing protein n=1 Tax=Armatimonas sp. TaxID=1872638 RepID=UPI00286AA17C
MKNKVLITLTAGSLLAISISLTNIFTLPVHAQKASATSHVRKATTKSKTPTRHDINTVSGLSAYLKELKQAKKAAGVKEKLIPGTNVRVLPGTGIYEERLARLRERAYPNDKINTEAIFRAISQRERMQAATTILQQRSPVTFAATSGGNPSAIGAWEFIGPKNLTVPYTTYYGPADSALTGRVSGIAFHPTDPKTIYIAAPIGGIHKTTDGGTTWAAIGDSFPIPFTSSVAVDPSNPNIVYAGLGDHDYSIDTQGWWFGGAYNARQFGGIMRSTDGGATWDRTMDFLQGCAINAIVTDPDTPGLVMAAVYGGTAASVYRSVDYGATWSVKPATKSLIVNAEDVEIGVRDASGK